MSTPKASLTESKLDQFYMPAASLPEKVSKVEAFVTDHLTSHGRVPIPTSYFER
jgi:hypothetical protein